MSRASRERWAAAHDRYDRTLQTFERGLAKVQALTETSEGGEVSVEIDARGKVTGVTVGGAWERECQPDQLASVILSTIGKGQATQLGQWALAAAPEEPEPISSRPIREPDYQIAPVHGARGDTAVADAIREVGGLRGAVDELIDEMKAVASTTHTGRSSSGHATATANGRSEIVGLEFDLEWLGHAHSFNIGREALEAMEAAMRRAAAVTVEQVFADSRLGRLQGLLTQRAHLSTPPPPADDDDTRSA